MTNLFTVTTQTRAVHVARDGQHFASDVAARSHNAAIAMEKAYSSMRTGTLRDTTLIHILTHRTSRNDLVILRDMVAGHVESVKPRFLAIEGPIGWVDGVRHPIEHPWGDTSDDRHQASLRTLEALIGWLASDVVVMYGSQRPVLDGLVPELGLPTHKLSQAGVFALCNLNPHARGADASRATAFRLSDAFRAHFDLRDARGRLREDVEERFLKALDAAIAELATPVQAS
jgi:hypothetical protein